MKLEVGMYVRTKYGISKIISNPNESRFNIDIFKKDGITLRCIRGKDVFKASHNIIDLIEVGDYVNGCKITLINEPSMANCNKRLVYAEDEQGYLIKMFGEKDIKSIVTKEQFESMSYKLEG